MLDVVVASFLGTLSEREFFDAFAAILRANGFYDVHLTHGTSEYGRDFVAKRVDGGIVRQYAIQTKVGNISQAAWREDRNQIEDIRLTRIANPAFDPDLPRVAVLATTGRLTGNAPTSAHGYKDQYEDGETFFFEVWPIERLLEMIVDAPEAGLSGGPDAAILGAIAAIHMETFTESQLEHLSDGWVGEGTSGLWRAALTAFVVSSRLACSGRTDLAAMTGAHLVRAVWASVHGAEPPPETAIAVADIGRALLRYFAGKLMTEVVAIGTGPRDLIGATQDAGLVMTYPVRCMRVVELAGLSGLAEEDEHLRQQAAEVCRRFIAEQPGASHPPSDNWAVSIVPAALLIAEFDRNFVARWLEQLCVWLADHYQRGHCGLARPLSSPEEEVTQLFGGSLEFLEVDRRSESFIASVLLDLAAALQLTDAYDAIINDVLAVDIYPQVIECDDAGGQYQNAYEGVYIELWMRYDERADVSPDWTCAPHHRRSTQKYLERIGRPWDLLAVCSVLRDRCFPSIIRGFRMN